MQSITDEEIGRLHAALKTNCVIERILHLVPRLEMPNWYLGAGCVAQTVWNILHGYDPTRNIQVMI